ncbi:MAG TPA: serine/threonine-protein kinase [Gemmataceae bacterium]|nr:serine/threonine-protein kinase [Gemmataceae bacterium]
MSPNMPCPSADALRRSLDPDESMTEAERQRIEAHVHGCQRGCKQAIDAFLRGNSLPAASEPAPTTVEAAPSPPEPAAPTVAKPCPPAGAVARDEQDAETRALLRRRLLVIFTILAGLGGTGALAEMVTGVAYQWWHWLQPGLWGGLALLLAGRRLSLPALRGCELVGFCSFGPGWCWFTALLSSGDFLRRLGDVPNGVGLSAFSISLMWFSLIAVYGTAVPNTWRRAAIIIGGMAATPFVVVVCTWWFDPPPVRVQSAFLICLGWWMALGFATALFGSHKLSQYRREAAEARRLGPYTLVRKLGAGGMGEVYLAQHRLLKRPCAVKVVRPDQAADPQQLARFEREVQATAGLTHPNAVQVYDYGRTPDGAFYYAMEYLPGLNLQDLVRRHGPLPPGRAVYLLRQVCGALREAHAAGLIHRDVKPGNVIVCDRGGVSDVAKVLDFGLVRDVSAGAACLTQDGTIAGTPAYMAPEQASGASVDARTDVYAIGGLAYFLLTGQPVFADPSALKVLAAHLYEAPAPPSRRRPEVAADLDAVVLRCLAKAPADRFPDVASLEAALGACTCAGQWSPAEAAAWQRSQAGAGVLAAGDAEA